MSRAADKLTSLILALVVMALVWKLYKREEKAVEAPRGRDLFNMQEFPARQKQFASEDRLEKRA